MSFLCSVEGCENMSEYEITLISNNQRFSFDVCEEHSKVNWKIEKPDQRRPVIVGGSYYRLLTYIYNCGYKAGHQDTVEGCYTDILEQDMDTYQDDIVKTVLNGL